MATANLRVPTNLNNGNTPLWGWGGNLTANGTYNGWQNPLIYWTQHQFAFQGPMDYARGFIFVINSPTRAPTIPQSTTYPNAQ